MKKRNIQLRISDEQKKTIEIGSELYGSKAAFMDMLLEVGGIIIRHKCKDTSDIISLEQLKRALLTPK